MNALAALRRVPLRAGVRDLLLSLPFIALGVHTMYDEPFRDSSPEIPFAMAGILICAGLLLLLPWRFTTILGMCVHMLLIVIYGGMLLLAIFLCVTILFFGLGLVLGLSALILLGNSAAAIAQSLAVLNTGTEEARRLAQGAA